MDKKSTSHKREKESLTEEELLQWADFFYDQWQKHKQEVEQKRTRGIINSRGKNGKN